MAPVRRPFLFCSDLCAEEASTVRYARRAITDGRIHDAEVVEAVMIRVAMVVRGGYPARARNLSPAEREAVFRRDDYRCQICGGEAI